jgi:hypothetical protein
MANYTLIKISLYDVVKDTTSTHWTCIYDTSIIYLGIRDFKKRYQDIIDKYKRYQDIVDKYVGYNLQPYNYRNPFWREGTVHNIGIMVRGFKCYKYWNDITINKDYVIHKDLMKDFVKVI